MSFWIKICGLTTRESVDAAIAAGATAIGFVFAPSKRQVSAERALRLTLDIPASIVRVAVMQHPAQATVDEVLGVFAPNVLQTDYEDLSLLKIPSTLRVLPVVRAGMTVPNPLPQRLLFEGPVSGAGETADWRRAAQLSKETQLILAGGLSPSNVGAAIEQVRPYGVDVSSGVESAPGVKDPKKIFEFVRAAKKAYE